MWGFGLLIKSIFFLNIPLKGNNLVAVRPIYLIFIGFLKTGGGRRVQAYYRQTLSYRYKHRIGDSLPNFGNFLEQFGIILAGQQRFLKC